MILNKTGYINAFYDLRGLCGFYLQCKEIKTKDINIISIDEDWIIFDCHDSYCGYANRLYHEIPSEVLDLPFEKQNSFLKRYAIVGKKSNEKIAGVTVGGIPISQDDADECYLEEKNNEK